MSHMVSGEIEIKDIDSMQEACESLGLIFRRGATTFEWFGIWVNDYHGKDAAYRKIDPKTFGKCEHAIKIPDVLYEIGLVRDKEGKLRLAYDKYDEQIENNLGVGVYKLVQAYAEKVAEKSLRRKGYSITKTVQSDGKVVLRAIRQ